MNWSQIKISSKETQWGGEPAGALIANYLRPLEFTLYKSKKRLELMSDLKLLPDSSGDIKVYKRFWGNSVDENIYVPDILVYADLLNHGDPRNLETANRIYEKHLQDRFE